MLNELLLCKPPPLSLRPVVAPAWWWLGSDRNAGVERDIAIDVAPGASGGWLVGSGYR